MTRKTREPWIVVDKLDAGTLKVEDGITSADYIQFDLAYSDGQSEGRLQWNITDGTLEVGMPGGVVNLQIGQENLIRAKNASGGDVANGVLVYVSGASGSRPEFDVADPDSTDASRVIGWTTEAIVSLQNGYLTTFGLVRGVDTSGVVAGDRLWLTDDGAFSDTAPTAPRVSVCVGYCLFSNVDSGIVFATTDAIPNFSTLSDVYIPSTPNNGEFTAWDTAAARFEIVDSATFDTDTGDLVANSVTASTEFVLTPSGVADITAVGGITPTNAIMYIQGDGGAVTVTADPQIAAGTDGDLLYVIGSSDVNMVTLNDGTGLHLHGPIILADHDILLLVYDSTGVEWKEVARNIPLNTLSGYFSSRVGASGTTYAEGYYDHAGTSNDFSPSVNFGTANISYAAHAFVVTGELSVDEIQITVSGASITDAGVRNGSDTEIITIPDATDADAYFETAKKWLGQIAIVVTSGTAKLCDYGWAKYYDNNNNDFTVIGIQVTGRGGANDSGANVALRHHKTTGWTYTGSGATPPAYIADMITDNGPESEVGNGLPFAWKRANLSTVVLGAGSEGILFEIVTTSNNAIEQANFVLTYTPK